jgi:hypothetical protein
MSDLVFTKGGSPSIPPPTGTASIYAKTDGHFYTMDETGTESSLQGPAGPTGPTGAGVPTGGTVGQYLVKNSSTNYDTSWASPTGPIQVALSASGTLTAVEQSVEVNAASPCTITLPAASAMIVAIGGSQHFSKITIFNTGTTAVTVAANGTDTIDGAATASIQFQWSSITLHPNYAGSGWMVV